MGLLDFRYWREPMLTWTRRHASVTKTQLKKLVFFRLTAEISPERMPIDLEWVSLLELLRNFFGLSDQRESHWSPRWPGRTFAITFLAPPGASSIGPLHAPSPRNPWVGGMRRQPGNLSCA